MQRRELIKLFSLIPYAGSVSLIPWETAAAAPPNSEKRNLFKELGVRTFINAAGTFTAMTGSLMHDYVLEAYASGATEFCMLDEVQDKVGEKIAALVHSEAAVVTSGAFSGMTLGLAGILTGMDQRKVEQLQRSEER